jgi:hypothetical protein
MQDPPQRILDLRNQKTMREEQVAAKTCGKGPHEELLTLRRYKHACPERETAL